MTTTITHDDAITALRAAGLGELLAHRWACEDHDSCDTAWMLMTVDDLDTAIQLLDMGFAPDGATPEPAAAQWLMDRRRQDR